MPTQISKLADVHPEAELGDDCQIGPFCVVGPKVKLGTGCVLQSNVVIVGNTTIGDNNRFFPGVVIGGEPQDLGFRPEADTKILIGHNNCFREGVTVHLGAEKEDHITRIDNNCLLMSNSHVAHNCHVYSNVILVNGVLLGGHVHVHDGAIISGNSAIHHFSTVGTLAFVAGLSRVTVDVPPYMMCAGIEDFEMKTINIVGMKRRGISTSTIATVKQAFKLLFRDHKPAHVAQDMLYEELGGVLPMELSNLFHFLELQRKGKSGRGREALRMGKPDTSHKQEQDRRAA